MEDLTGKQFGPYRVVAPLGEGGMAAVYRAYQASVDRYVALKVLPRYFASDPQFVGRFQQEAKVLAKLQHLHILAVHDFGEADGYTYIVMPFVETGTLADLLKGEPLPLTQIGQIVGQVASALDYAHSQGVVHRDVKPSNILIDRHGNCLLTDFGIAKIVEGTVAFTQTGGIIGTPTYMSPEQIRGDILDGRSDVYSLGVVLYEMATGRAPFRAETPPAIFVKHLHDPLPPPHIHNADIPEGVERVILKALSKEREDRFKTTGEMAAALAKGIVGELPTVVAAEKEVEKVPDLPPPPKRLAATELAPAPEKIVERPEKREPPIERVMPKPPAKPVREAMPGPPAVPVERVEPRPRVEPKPPAEPVERIEPRPRPKPVERVAPQPPGEAVERRLPKWAWGAIGGVAIVAVVAVLIAVLASGGEPEEELAEPAGVGGLRTEETEPSEAPGSPEEVVAPEREPEPFTIRVQVTSSSDWAEVELRYPAGEIQGSTTVETGGEVDEAGLDGSTIFLNQDLGLAEEGQTVSLVEDVTLQGEGGTVSFTVERGCMGRALVEVFNLATGEPSLLVQWGDERGCMDPSTFFVPTADLASASPPPPPPPLPTESPGVALFERGVRLMEEADWFAALEAFDQALATGWGDAELYFQRGWACLHVFEEGGDCGLEQSVEYYSTAIDLEPGRTQYYVERAWAYHLLREFDLAISDWSQAIEMNPEEPHFWRARAASYVELGDLEAALADHNRAIQLGAGDAGFYVDRAWVYYNMGETELAIADWQAALEMEPENAWLMGELGGRYAEMGDFEAALEYQDRAIEIEPENGELYHMRAYTYLMMGDVEQATADWTQAAELEPDNPWAWSELGNRMAELGDFGAALEYHNRAIDIEPENAQLYANRGWAYHNMGDSGSAEADFARAVELDPENPWLWRDRGNFYSNIGQFEAALENHDRAIELGAQDSWFFIDRGWVEWNLGGYEYAIADWSAAIEMNPSEPWHWWDRANGYAVTGDVDAARADYEEFLRLSEGNPEEYEGPRAEAEAWLAQH
jgi:serine/threonine protein kinase/tetratricopeptide (TPR) repeat protein